MEKALAPFIEKATEIKEPPPKRKASNGGKMAAIRAWANQNGWKLGDHLPRTLPRRKLSRPKEPKWLYSRIATIWVVWL